MKFDDDVLKWCDRDRLKMQTEDRKAHREQAGRLIKKLRDKLAVSSEYRVKKIIPAGSLEKGTILQPVSGKAPDADIVVYLRGTLEEFDLPTMQEDVIKLLMAVYPQMKREQFQSQPRTLGIAFSESGLEIDLVPVIAHPDEDDFGFQPVPNGDTGEPMLTSAPGQLAFINARRKGDPLYRTVVRFIKKWRNERELDYLSSFAIELLVAHIQDALGPAPSVFDGVSRFFNFIAEHQLLTPIAFPENGTVGTLPPGSAVLLDPVNADNNVFARLSDSQRKEFIEEAGGAWATLWEAHAALDEAETAELWRTVLGRAFRLESAA